MSGGKALYVSLVGAGETLRRHFQAARFLCLSPRCLGSGRYCTSLTAAKSQLQWPDSAIPNGHLIGWCVMITLQVRLQRDLDLPLSCGCTRK